MRRPNYGQRVRGMLEPACLDSTNSNLGVRRTHVHFFPETSR